MKRSHAEVSAGVLLVSFLVVASPSAAQTTFSIQDVTLLTGCWAGEFGDLQLREQWSDADGGVMLGTTRFLRDGSVVDFEFGMLVGNQEGVTLWPYPRGEKSPDGFPLVSKEAELVFENLEHDFPVRIVYQPDGSNTLRPRIEGRDGESRAWHLERIRCPTAR